MTPRHEQNNTNSCSSTEATSDHDESDEKGDETGSTTTTVLILGQCGLGAAAPARRALGLIFDLDGTLVAELADDDSNNGNPNFLPDHIFFRPGAQAFLRWCRSRGHALAIWTAAHASWAHYVSWKLSSSEDCFDFVWDSTKLRKRRRIPVDAHGLEMGSCRWCGPYRDVCDRCTCSVVDGMRDGMFQCPCRSTKDLNKVWRKQKHQKHRLFSKERTVLIENTPQECLKNYGNAVYVPTYTGSQEDRILARLQELILQLECVPDVRSVRKCNCGERGRHACMEQNWWWGNSKSNCRAGDHSSDSTSSVTRTSQSIVTCVSILNNSSTSSDHESSISSSLPSFIETGTISHSICTDVTRDAAAVVTCEKIATVAATSQQQQQPSSRSLFPMDPGHCRVLSTTAVSCTRQ